VRWPSSLADPAAGDRPLARVRGGLERVCHDTTWFAQRFGFLTGSRSSETTDSSNEVNSHAKTAAHDAEWTCRMLIVGLNDGTQHFAKFRFK
jgi:hypothetical protein